MCSAPSLSLPFSASSGASLSLSSPLYTTAIRAWLGHVSIDTTNIYAEVDLQRKAEVLAHSNSFSTAPTTNKRWKDDASLLAFLRSL